MRLIYMGTPDFAVFPLENLIKNQHIVVAVYTAPDQPAGRGRTLVPPPVKKAAVKLGLDIIQPSTFKSAEVVAQLAAFEPDAIVVAAYGKLLPQAVLDIPRLGCVNIHPSLLPRHRGASPIPSAILAGDVFTGVSIMLMDVGMDTGPVLQQSHVPVNDNDTTGTLTDKLSYISSRMLVGVLDELARGERLPRPQDNAIATYCKPIDKEQGLIDWKLPAAQIWRQVRAFQPWPGCFTQVKGKRLEIISAVPLPVTEAVEPGKVVLLPKDAGAGFGVGTGDGMLGILRVQAEGKQAMPAADFIRGQRQLAGEILT